MTTWVLLRGLARDARHWGDFVAALGQRLPAGDTLVALDLPGNGLRWREKSPATVAGMVAAARRELVAGGHSPPYLPVAISLGGMVALHWAAVAGQELEGCVLINSSVAGMSAPWRRLRPAGLVQLLGLLVPGRSALAREQRILGLTSNRPVDAATAAQWARHAQATPLSRANVLRQLWAAGCYRPGAAPAVPILLLASRHDRLVSVRCSRSLAQAWGLPLGEHPAAGHDLPLDDPHWVVEQVLSWHEARSLAK